MSVWIRFAQAGSPLPDVAGHLLEAVGAGASRGIGANRADSLDAAFAGVAAVLIEAVAPGIDAARVGLRVPARRLLPFRLGRQPPATLIRGAA